MSSNKQRSLFDRPPTSKRRVSRWKSFFEQYAGKAKLKLNPQKEEKNFTGKIKQWMNLPLFHGISSKDKK